jgi:ubiquitin C-terminal hydrolase
MANSSLTYHQDYSMCGIKNLGNTCYMSATLQCLIHTEPLKEFFLSQVNSQGSLAIQSGFLTKALGEVMHQMWENPQKLESFEPKNIKKAIGRLDKRFKGSSQEDAQELLTYLIKGLHDELNEVRKKEYIKMTIDPNDKDEDTSTNLWKWYQMRDKSRMIDIFYGQIKISSLCPECSTDDKKFEVFNQLALPVSFDSEKEEVVIDLEHCLKQFMTNETTELLCDKCGAFRTTVKNQKTFFKLPKILVLHLKRFEVKNNTQQLLKITRSISFPLE